MCSCFSLTIFKTFAVSSASGGDVFIYQRIGNDWTQLGDTISFVDFDSDLKADTVRNQETILQVKITDSGEYIAIGSPNSDDNGLNSGKLNKMSYFYN